MHGAQVTTDSTPPPLLLLLFPSSSTIEYFDAAWKSQRTINSNSRLTNASEMSCGGGGRGT